MKRSPIKMWRLIIICLGLGTPVISHAVDWWFVISAINGMNHALSGKIGNMDTDLQAVINHQTEQLTGHFGFGSLHYDQNLMNWGQGSDTWSSVVNLYHSGNGGLGQTMASMVGDFPVLSQPQASFNPYMATREKDYITLSSKTTLATRASSQLAFDKINQEMQVIHSLNQQIDSAPNAKAALDLNNRLTAENAEISLQLEKLLAAMLQQQAVENQGAQMELQNFKDFYNLTGN